MHPKIKTILPFDNLTEAPLAREREDFDFWKPHSSTANLERKTAHQKGWNPTLHSPVRRPEKQWVSTTDSSSLVNTSTKQKIDEKR